MGYPRWGKRGCQRLCGSTPRSRSSQHFFKAHLLGYACRYQPFLPVSATELSDTILEQVAPKLNSSDAAKTYATTAQGGYGTWGRSSLGDSTTAVNQSADPGPRIGSIHSNLLSILSGQRILWREKFATPGQTIDYIRTRHVPQVIALDLSQLRASPLACRNE